MKQIIFLFVLFVSSHTFASEYFDLYRVYVKAEAGYSFIVPEIENAYLESNCFQFTPSIGVFPFFLNDSFAIETSCFFGFGSSEYIDIRVIAPKVMALFYIPVNEILDFYILDFDTFFGVGLSAPIQCFEFNGEENTSVNFKLDMKLGLMYEFIDEIKFLVSFNSGLFRPWEWGISAGISYFL